MSLESPSRQISSAFRHEALLYAGEAEFADRVGSFVRQGVEARDPVLVVVGAAKIALLRRTLGRAAGSVLFADMAEVGTNPARIIPAWREFVSEHPGTPGSSPRGVGEPVWPERSAAELAECQRHEELLNVAFAGSPGFWLLCPYDTAVLDPAVVDGARRSHPLVHDGASRRKSDGYPGLGALSGPFDAPLSEPPADRLELTFGPGSLKGLRDLVSRYGSGSGLGEREASDFVLAVHEVATNSQRYGGGGGTLRLWREADTVVCEVGDRGRLRDPLAGRERPAPTQDGRRGLWLANQLCDLVQVRSFPAGTVVRVHRRPA